jgi:hypothetical protein
MSVEAKADPTAYLVNDALPQIAKDIDDDKPMSAYLVREAANVLRAQAAQLDAVRDLHKPYGIYDECDHDHDGKDGPDVVLVEDIGFTCAKLYDICSACCEPHAGQSLFCSEAHDHGPDKPICATRRILEGPKP